MKKSVLKKKFWTNKIKKEEAEMLISQKMKRIK